MEALVVAYPPIPSNICFSTATVRALVPAPASSWPSSVERGGAGCCPLVIGGHARCQRDRSGDLSS
eukprot:3716610-Prymnesium_polylepis.1